jgi:prepilin-type N-terminal cleavage/methylation domain-containing protein
MNRIRRQSGFTLMEILLAIGILAVGITSVLFLFTMGARSHRRAVDRTRSALLAETVINQLRADFAEGLPDYYVEDEGDIQAIHTASHADFPEFTYDVVFEKLYPGDTRGDFYKVRVIVRWGDPDVERDERNSHVYETILRRKNS